jgi:predicted RNA-binding protein with PIN domain
VGEGRPAVAGGGDAVGRRAGQDGGAGGLAPGGDGTAGGSARRRVPLRLPGGIFDDSAEAAEHLLRSPGVALVVDGYNVTMTGWPALAASEQRRRLVGALAEVAARTSTEIDIVFDGADIGAVPVPAPVRSLVHVRFSPAGVEADDVVLDLVAHLPPARPVVVASSDNRVRDGARALGANVVHARQLLDALRR